jgi:hypothetical protein
MTDRRRFFTEAERAAIEQAAAAGRSHREVAAGLARHARAVRQFADKNGIAFRRLVQPLTAPLKDRIGRLVALGLSSKMIGRLVGRSKPAIEHVKRTEGFYSPPPMTRVLRLKLSERAHAVLCAAGVHHGEPPGRIARYLIEAVTAGRLDLISKILPVGHVA